VNENLTRCNQQIPALFWFNALASPRTTRTAKLAIEDAPDTLPEAHERPLYA
jgi:hypothetical protein